MVKINGEGSKKKSALIHYKLCSKLFLYLNTGVKVPELAVKWTLLTRNVNIIMELFEMGSKHNQL